MTIPTNITDAIAAIQDGTVGVINDIMIGDLLVSALVGLDAPETLTVTRKPVQQGFDITYAAVHDLNDLTLNIVLGNPDFSVEAGIQAAMRGTVQSFVETWTDKREQLYTYKDTKEIVKVQTHDRIYTRRLINGIFPIYDPDENYEAWFGTVTFAPVPERPSTSTGGKKAQGETWLGGL